MYLFLKQNIDSLDILKMGFSNISEYINYSIREQLKIDFGMEVKFEDGDGKNYRERTMQR